MEELMTDMMSEDESATILLDRVTNVACEQASAFAAAGADILHLGDDIGTQRGPLMSVELWRTWLKPRLKRVIDAARAAKPDVLIFYHSCGNVSAFLEELVETGIDILNPVQPECMDFAAVHARVGAHVAFWGTIGTQSTLPFGTPEDVRRAVLDRFEICGKQGGLVLGPTHLVEPEVPWENLVALKAAVDEVNA
jgi:uroporphyrinogen decarboxylase